MTAPEIDRVVIVGGGISGLAAGILLAEQGRRVTIVEWHTVLGGYLQSFQRRGVRFEVGFHHLGASLPGEPFARYLKLLGVYEDLRLLPYRDDALFHVALPDGRRLAIPRGPARFAEAMARQFPQEAGGVGRVQAEIAACVEASPWLGLRGTGFDADAYQRAMEISLRDVVEAHVTSGPLRDVCYALGFNSTLPPALCPFGMYALMVHVLTTSCARVEGGGAALIEAFERRFRALGGTVLLGRSAERLRLDGKRARALELSDGSALDLDLLIATCHPQETVRFCGREAFGPAFLDTLDAHEQTRGSFKLYIELEQPIESLGLEPWFVLDPASPWAPGLFAVSPSRIDPTYEGRHAAEILFWQDFRDVDAWQGSSPGRRPPEYEAFKERTADAALDRLDREFPGLRRTVLHRYTSTPLTNLHYTRSARGAAMGIRQDIHHQGLNHLRPRNRLRNVLLAGQSLGVPGIAGCVINSTVLCNALLPEARLLDRLRETCF